MPGALATPVYLDNAATSWPKPREVCAAVRDCLARPLGNPGRAAHKASLDAGRILFACRTKLAALLGVGEPTRVVFTLNATDGLNMVIKGLVRSGDRVVTTVMEHNSILRPLYACQAAGASVVYLDPRQDFLSALARALTTPTRLLAVSLGSNVTGQLLPAGEVAACARAHGVPLLLDGAQAAGKAPIDVDGWGVDYLAFSGHKGLLGPQGTGGLAIGRHAPALTPWREGGTGTDSALDAQPSFLPDRLEAGTPNTPGLAGLAAALDCIALQGAEVLMTKVQSRAQAFRDAVQDLPGIHVLEPSGAAQLPIVSLWTDDADVGRLAAMLAQEYGVYTRAGLHCAPRAHMALGTYPQGALRVSPGPYTTQAHIQHASAAVAESMLRLRKEKGICPTV